MLTFLRCLRKMAQRPDVGYDGCKCNNPLIAAPYEGSASHKMFAFGVTKEMAKNASSLEVLDVVFLGDSITECWNGLHFGRPESFCDASNVFNSVLTRAGGGAIDAVALGIAGDRVSTVTFVPYFFRFTCK